MTEEINKRKKMRLQEYDYNQDGAYFITICTRNRECFLSRIVGTGVPDGPCAASRFTQNLLTAYGRIADKYIHQLDAFYADVSVKSYVIMPNHIHLLLMVSHSQTASPETRKTSAMSGPSRTPVPTNTIQNSVVSRWISTFKRFCNKEYGINIWQSRSYDHIIRDLQDYDTHMKYISDNPEKWFYDELYRE